MDQWTPQVTARKEMGQDLKKRSDLLKAHNIKVSDVDVLITEGTAAEEADAEQKEQLTEGAVERAGRSDAGTELFERERILRDVVAAIVDDLKESFPDQSLFLAKLSFARFRTREFEVEVANAPQGGAPAEGETDAEDIRSVKWVKREDRVTRARNLGRYCRAILRPGREAIVAAFAERNYTLEQLEALASDAEAFAAAGRNTPRAAEATEREAAAVRAQKRKWAAIRRLIRRAVKDDKALAAKFAEC